MVLQRRYKYHDFVQVAKLRRIWESSKLIKLLAVRKVTQDNRGKRTAGVDGRTAKQGWQRIELANNLEVNGEALPLRRVEIPKPNGKLSKTIRNPSYKRQSQTGTSQGKHTTNLLRPGRTKRLWFQASAKYTRCYRSDF
ncbi:MAG: hypothetical protein DRR16_18890 [Candidatus Parabeggiatoa sp. nov. 3]|nr:MAG: hypothetical protein DRR16_18890 [Gammaproteobacteria bacterium]